MKKYKFPTYQVLIVLLVIPMLYTVRNHFQIIPSIKTCLPPPVVAISSDEFFVAAWLSIVILHWTGLSIVYVFIKANKIKPVDLGYSLSTMQTLIFISALVIIGALFVILKSQTNYGFHNVMKSLSPVLHSKGEYWAWVFLSINAGFCEEIVYRGFGINSLKAFGLPRLVYFPLPIVSWILIHNLDTFPSPAFGLICLGFNGLLFTGLYAWRKNLNFSIGLHAVGNLLIILI